MNSKASVNFVSTLLFPEAATAQREWRPRRLDSFLLCRRSISQSFFPLRFLREQEGTRGEARSAATQDQSIPEA